MLNSCKKPICCAGLCLQNGPRRTDWCAMNTQRAVALSLCLPRCWKKTKLLENIWQEIFEHVSRRQMLFSNAAGECGRCLFHSYFEDIGRPWTQEQGWGVFQLRCRCFPGIMWSFIKPSALTMKDILLLPKVMPSTSSTATSLKTILPEEPGATHIARRPPIMRTFLDGIVLVVAESSLEFSVLDLRVCEESSRNEGGRGHFVAFL